MFDWTSFLDNHQIEYVTSGPNVARGNINCRCPYCGDDPSHHMGISLEGKGWGCWRRPEHRGRSTPKLISALLGCSLEEARNIAGLRTTTLPADFNSQVLSMLDSNSIEKRKPTKLSLLPEFKPLRFVPSAKPYLNYLRNRGFADLDAVLEYGLYYCTKGVFRGRIIFPVYYKRKLITWTGRSIYNTEPIRYLTLTTDHDRAWGLGLPVAVGPITDYLLWYDVLPRPGSSKLLLVEGPLDSLKLMYLGTSIGIDSVCFFTQRPTAAQISLLYDLIPKYKQTFVMLDREASVQSFSVVDRLLALGVKSLQLPYNVDDPGDLPDVWLLKKIVDGNKMK